MTITLELPFGEEFVNLEVPHFLANLRKTTTTNLGLLCRDCERACALSLNA